MQTRLMCFSLLLLLGAAISGCGTQTVKTTSANDQALLVAGQGPVSENSMPFAVKKYTRIVTINEQPVIQTNKQKQTLAVAAGSYSVVVFRRIEDIQGTVNNTETIDITVLAGNTYTFSADFDGEDSCTVTVFTATQL